MLKLTIFAALCAIVAAKPGLLHETALPEVVDARTVLPAYSSVRTLGANVLGVDSTGLGLGHYYRDAVVPSYHRSVYPSVYSSYPRTSLLPASYASYRSYGNLGGYYASPYAYRSYPRLVSVAPSYRTVLSPVADYVPSHHSVVPSLHNVVPSVRTVVPSVHSVVPSVHSVVPSVHSVVPSVRTVVPSVHSVLPKYHSVVPSVSLGVPSVSAGAVLPAVTSGVALDLGYRANALDHHQLKSYGWNYDSMKNYGW